MNSMLAITFMSKKELSVVEFTCSCEGGCRKFEHYRHEDGFDEDDTVKLLAGRQDICV